MVRVADPELVEEFMLPYEVACCIHRSVAESLEMAGLYAPEKGGVTYKLDGEWACDCESLWVWWNDTEGGNGEFGVGNCRITYERVFTVLLAWDLCTEALSPCTPGGPALPSPCWDPEEQGCPDPPIPAIIEPGKCVDNEWVDPVGQEHVLGVDNETAWIWAARYAIERKFPYLLQCCLRECTNLPSTCKGIRFETVNSNVEGNCAFTEFRVRLKW